MLNADGCALGILKNGEGFMKEITINFQWFGLLLESRAGTKSVNWLRFRNKGLVKSKHLLVQLMESWVAIEQ